MTTPEWGSESPDEVNALLRTLTRWAQRAVPAPPSGHAGPECQWCPLCQLASALRGEHPELTDRLAEAGAAVSGAARALLDSASRMAPGPGTTTATPTGAASGQQSGGGATTSARSRPRPRIEHIELDDVPGPG